MITIKGKSVCSGIAFGKLELIKNKTNIVQRARVDDTQKELERLETALKKADEELEKLYNKALGEVGEENAMIFEIHQMMLKDDDYIDSIKSNITDQKLNAESAVATSSDTFADMFSSMDDSYMKARAMDVRDISERLIAILTNKKNEGIKSEDSVVIGAIDLAPSQTVQFDKSKILAFVTEKGSVNSHTSILARTMNIPAIIGAEGIVNESYDRQDVIVDGYSGKIYINPDMSTVLKMQEKKQKSEHQNSLLQKLKGVKPVTKDGKQIMLYANIGSENDLASVYANDAMGVGLFRSEFIYLESKNYPTEDEQFAIYKNVAQKALGKRVIIRTLDIGADKQVDYFQMPKEENPAMGVRAIRICLTRPQIFRTQLRALYRASAFGKIAIMFPMITSVEEVIKIKQICDDVKKELEQEKIPFNRNVELGIMIETPASAIISDILAKEIDFFSIGTNDLTQYTLAIDRQNDAANMFCDVHHTAILRLIKMVTDNAHKEGIWAGICGELAGDMSLTETFLAIGVDELSVSPSLILSLKQKIIETDVSQIKQQVLEKLM